MNFKRILVIIMTFAILMSTFAPTLGVFAENLNNGTNQQESNEKHYVSIGDSMANGYGFDGYEQGNDGVNIINNQDKFYGAGAYPLQFEEYLKSQGYDVTHTKLASSALRAEDLLYLLGGRENPADDWFDQVNYYTGIDDNTVLSAFYQNAVKDADIITLGVGNASFGAFFLSRVTSLLNVMGGSLDEAQKEMYKLDNALSLLENEEDKELVKEVYANVIEKIDSFVSPEYAEQYSIDAVTELLAYTAAGFVINFAKSVDRIVELNSDVEIILVGLMNTTYGMTITLENGEKFYFGDLMDEVFALLNDYIVLCPTLKQAEGKLQDATFHYAQQPQPKFIVQVFDDLAYAGWTNIDCGEDDCGTEGHVCENGRLSADIVRARTIKTYNSGLRKMIGAAMFGSENALSVITLDDVKAWKSWDEMKQIIADQEGIPGEYIDQYLPDENMYYAYGYMHGDSDLTTSVAIYLGIEDAIVKSIAVDDIPLEGVMTIADTQKLLTVFDGLGDISASPYAIREGLGAHLSKDHILPLCKIYAIFNIGDGMCVHPTPAGHDDLAEVIVKSYKHNGIPASVVVEKMKHVYKTADSFGMLNSAELEMLEEIYRYLSAHKYITNQQTLDILLSAYTSVNDGEVTEDELKSVCELSYETLLKNPLLTNADRVAIVGKIYTTLKTNGYFNEYLAVEVAEEIYDTLRAENLITDAQTYAIVDYVYNVVIDGTLTDEELLDVVVYVYKLLIKNEAPARQMRVRAAAANDDAKAAKTLRIVLSIVAENYLSEENQTSLETLVTGDDALISDELLIKIVDNAIVDLENNESDDAALVEKVSETVLKTVMEDPNTDMATKVEIGKEVAKIVENNNSTDAPVVDDATKVETIKQIVSSISTENMDAATQESINKLLLAENALISDELLVKIVDNVYAEIMNADTNDLAAAIENVSKVIVKTVVEDPDTDEATKMAIADEVLNTFGNSGILGEQGSDAYFEIRYLAGKLYSNLEAKGLLGETELRLIVSAVCAPLLYSESLSAEEVAGMLYDLNEIVFGRDDLTFDQKIEIFVVVYETLDEEGYITKENAEIILDFVLEYYDEAYEYGYAYVDGNGYIDVAVSALEKVLARLELVDLSDNGPMTEEFRELLQKEVDALEILIAKIIVVLDADAIKDVDGLVAVLNASVDDILLHLANIYGILAQAGIDVNQLVIIPALDEALEILETEVLPALNELLEELVDAIVAHVLEKAEMLYNEALEISKEVYLQLVELLVKVQLHVGEKAEEIVEALIEHFFALADVLETVYGDFEVALNKAIEILGDLVEKALEAKNDVEELLNLVFKSYPVVLEKLYKVLGDIDVALDAANEIMSYVIYRVSDVVTDVNDIAVLLNNIVTIVYEILVDAGVPVDEAMELAAIVAGEVLDELLEEVGGLESVLDAVDGLLDNALSLLLNSGLTYEQAIKISLGSFTAVITVVVRHFDDIDNSLDFTKEVLQTVYDFLVENRVEITQALKMAVDATKTVVNTIILGAENAEEIIKIAVEVTKTVIEFVIENTDDIERAFAIAKDVFASVFNFLEENGEDIKAALEIAGDVFVELVEFIIAHTDDIEAAIKLAVEAFEFVMDAAELVLDSLEEMHGFAADVYARLVAFSMKVHNVVNAAIDVYEFVYELIVDVFGSVENAGKIALKLTGIIVEYVKNSADLIENAYQLYVDIYNIVVSVYGETGDALKVAEAVYEYALGVWAAVEEKAGELIYNASNGDYVITEDSYYVALGNAAYAEELANMLFLGEKYVQLGLAENYIEELAKADLVTVKFNNGEIGEFARAQLVGTVAGIIRDNDNLTTIFDTLVTLGLVEQVEESLGFSIDAQTVALEWSKYVDAETEEIIHNLMARIRSDLVENGLPEYFDIAPALDYVLNQFLPVNLSNAVEIPVADLTVFAIESVLYAYVEAVDRVLTTIETINATAPDATVVITGLNNPIAALAPILEAYVDVTEYIEYAEVAVKALNAQLYAVALVNENIVFVETENAADIYEAIHARCGHAYDNACDTTCNICGETREVAPHVYDDCEDTTCNVCGAERVAPGHSFTNYVFNNDAACEKNGTETAKCDNCDATHTREAEGTALDHVWGEWEVVSNPTTESRGVRKCECELCGKVLTEEFGQKVDPGIPVWVVVAIAVGSVAVACGAGAAAYWFFRKRRDA